MKKKSRFYLYILIIVGIILILIISCKKDDDKHDKEEELTVTDMDGNEYNTITIGTQLWMAQNLKVTSYNDGLEIPNGTDNNVWVHLTTGAYCNYDNDTSYVNTYGRLYNWYAVNSGKLCPLGWHVPADYEWTALITYLGGDSIAGGKLKEADTIHWQSPNTGATNESGFTALPGGDRFFNGEFRGMGRLCSWWSSTEYISDFAFNHYVTYDARNARTTYLSMDFGLAVRCVRDE